MSRAVAPQRGGEGRRGVGAGARRGLVPYHSGRDFNHVVDDGERIPVARQE